MPERPRDIVARNLRRIRKERKLTQSELASRCGLTSAYVSALERGRQAISLRSLDRLAGALGVSPADLLQVVVSKDPPKESLVQEIHYLLKGLNADDQDLVLSIARKLVSRLRAGQRRKT